MPLIASPNLFNGDEDEPMLDAYEFSDVELEVGTKAVYPVDYQENNEPIHKRTRGQSKTKETSVPPAEPSRRQAKVKRATKKNDPDYEPRLRRRMIHEEPSIDSD